VSASPSSGIDRLVALALGGLCLAAYVATLTPGLSFPVMDSHELALNAIRLGVAHPSGYPVYTLFGFLWVHAVPFGDAAYRMNLLSAVMGAAAVGTHYLLIRALGPCRLAAAGATLLYGLGDVFWSQAVITEVYAANAFLQIVTMLVLIRWARRVTEGRPSDGLFLAFALLFGLSAGTHLSNLGFAPLYAAFVLLVDPSILRRPRTIAAAAALFAVALGQYAWLYLRGSRFDQYPNVEPDSLRGMWGYTLGAFSSSRFAYPVGILPFRLWFYLQQLTNNVGIAGVAIGMLGAWMLLWRSPFAFWLLLGMHVTNVFVFAQFSVPDPEVFFLPGYVPWAVFVGCGLQACIDAVAWAYARWTPSPRIAHAIVALPLVVWIGWMGARNFGPNDRSKDTLVPDFDRNVYDLLPPDSAVLSARGAFGADMLYWQVADKMRRDVSVLGQRETPPWDERRPLYATLRVADGEPTASARMGRRDLPEGAWYVPVLFGNARGMILSRVDRTPPSLVDDAPPSATERRLGPVTLVDAQVRAEPQAPTPRLHVQARWRVPDAARVVVATGLGDRTLESHTLGLENLARYADVVGLPPGSVVREDYRVVVPSTTPAGTHTARLGVTVFGEHGMTTEWIDVGRIDLP
jgi:hypothetical protein